MTGLTSRGMEIWSLVRASWRSLSADISIFHPSVLPRFSVVFSPCGWPPALVNDALHWSQLQKNMNHFILSFDMCSEFFGVIILPEVVQHSSQFISRYKVYLALFVNDLQLDCSTVSLWVMKEYGTIYRSVGFRKNGEVVLSTYWGMRSVNPMTKQINAFQIDRHRSYFFMDSFVESLVLLDQPNSFSD
ncbi:hypothetical protein ACFXTN_032277 [Malus domestica]